MCYISNRVVSRGATMNILIRFPLELKRSPQRNDQIEVRSPAFERFYILVYRGDDPSRIKQRIVRFLNSLSPVAIHVIESFPTLESLERNMGGVVIVRPMFVGKYLRQSHLCRLRP